MRKKQFRIVILNFYQHQPRRRLHFHFNAISFNASALSLDAVRFNIQKNSLEFTPFNYFNQILYHFNVETLIMLLNEEKKAEKMLYG